MENNLLVHPSEFWTLADTIEKITKRKLCVAKATGGCSGQIVEAHTIPRSQLQKMALDGHVYEIRATPGDLLKNDGKFSVGKRGIRKFSVLNFFCEKHDGEIFANLENGELTFDAHQLALLHYRAMGAEFYKKYNAIEIVRHQLATLNDMSIVNKAQRRETLKAFEAGTLLGVRDMARTFPKCEALLVNSEHDRVNALIVQFRKMPSIMTVGGFSPEFDYDGRSLQTLGRANSQYEQIGLSILAANNRAAVVFTWLNEAKICSDFAQSFIAQRPELLATLAIQTAFEHLENTCMNISWWDSLRQIERDKLVERMQLSGSFMEDRKSSCLSYCGITFDQWEYESHRFVGAALRAE